jgi:DNA-binding HxlR family transcriptional regulator
MRSYQQYCGLAKALDVVGDRWTLLIVRELLLQDECRFTDLQHGLPGIATNLLTDRLRDLEEAGLVARSKTRERGEPTVYSLTDRGKDLRPVIAALGKWAAPLLAHAAPHDKFRSHWMMLPGRLHLRDNTPRKPPATLEVRAGEEPITISARSGAVHIQLGSSENPDAVLSGKPDIVLALLIGRLELSQARARGVHYTGKPAVLDRLRPAH